MVIGLSALILFIPTAVAAPPAARPDIKEYAHHRALAYNLDPELFKAVIHCESSWRSDAVGDNGTSFGLAQLHYPTRDWGIATSTALDPYASIDIMADAWSRGESSRWTCWRMLKKLPQ